MSHPRVLHNFNSNDTKLQNVEPQSSNKVNTNDGHHHQTLGANSYKKVFNGLGAIASGVAGYRIGKIR